MSGTPTTTGPHTVQRLHGKTGEVFFSCMLQKLTDMKGGVIPGLFIAYTAL